MTEAELVAGRDGVTRVLWGLRPWGDVALLDEALATDHPDVRLSFHDGGDDVECVDGWRRRYIHFSRGLRRGESIAIKATQRFTVVGRPLPPFLRFMPVTRCDRARLQVAFAGTPPLKATYEVFAASGERLGVRQVAVDEVTASFTHVVDRPIVGRYYKLAW